MDVDVPECWIQRSGNFEPNVIDTNINGVDGCLIRDIIEPHPSRSGLWKVVGRVDDQIMHSNGEKTNPGPLGKHNLSIFDITY